MQSCGAPVKPAGPLPGAELRASVREEDHARRESYSADWLSVTVDSRPLDRQMVSHADESRRESCCRYWEAQRLVQGCPSEVVRLGTLQWGVREHQQPPHRNTLPLPLFAPAELGLRLGRGAPLRPLAAPDGVCPGRRALEDITRHLPPVEPRRMDFAKVPRSLGRSASQEAQRG
ncbi:telethonin-like [Arapaima gigas]